MRGVAAYFCNQKCHVDHLQEDWNEYVLNNILHKTINEHYLMPTWIPSGILWIYIYFAVIKLNAKVDYVLCY